MGPTLTQEVMTHAGRASQPSYQPTDEATANRELRASWGKNYQRNVDGVRAAVRAANEKDPRIVPYLLSTGLGNDVAFAK